MVKKGGYTLGEYQGGYSSLDPNKTYGDAGFTGYRTRASSLGASTKPDTANQIQQVNQLLNQGMVPIEVGALNPEVFDQIPKKHFKELNRMAKLTGSKLSVHAPIVEPSGIGENGWSESAREMTERQLKGVVEKSAEISDKERVPITIHSSGNIPGSEWIPKKGTQGEGGQAEREKIMAIDRESGRPVPIEKEKMHRPQWEDFEKGRDMDPKKRLEIQNQSKWRDELDQLFFTKDRVDEILDKQGPYIERAFTKLQNTPEEKQDWIKESDPEVKKGLQAFENADTYFQDLQSKIHTDFEKAWKYTEGDEDSRGKLRRAASEYKELAEEAEKENSPRKRSEAIQKMISKLSKVTPQQFVPIEEFAIEHSSKTFGNVALDAYKKYGKKAPMINIENMYTGMAFSGRMEDLNNLIKKSKKNFVENATKSKNEGGLGLNEEKAKKAADDMIGMTLDLGHLNIAKKKGFSDKYLTEEAKKIADQVKHVHMADNFGYSDSHLPPGMGNVPNKEILQELEKQGRTEEMRKIVEAGGFVQHFGTSPHPYSLEGMGAPFYQEGEPYWNQAIGFQQGYSGGFGQMLPSGHFENYGIPSFSNLPADLGGQRMGGGGSRVSGTPIE